MSAQASLGNAGKKAVHVKWAGKTIALGTFPSQEADEKCAKAKALTRAWRSTMRPRPSREWVMLELERLGVRVVSGRLGRKAGEDGDEGMAAGSEKSNGGEVPTQVGGANVAGPAAPTVERNNSIGWSNEADFSNLVDSRRGSTLGLSMMQDRRGSMSSLGPLVGMDSGDPSMSNRPFGGGGAAAAFEGTRFDHLSDKAEQQRRGSSLGLGSLAGGGLGNMGMSVNPNQHYEMLKLHHMNLLNEIQETTLMMNLYQQQQLQQQQQQLQHQTSTDQLYSDPQMAMLLQQQGSGQNGLDAMFSAQLGQQHRASLGLGAGQLNGGGNFSAQHQLQLLQQQSQMLGNGNFISGGAGQSLENRIAQIADAAVEGEGRMHLTSANNGNVTRGKKRRGAKDGNKNIKNKRVKGEDRGQDNVDGDDDEDDEEDEAV